MNSTHTPTMARIGELINAINAAKALGWREEAAALQAELDCAREARAAEYAAQFPHQVAG